MLFPIQYFILSRDKQHLTVKRILLKMYRELLFITSLPAEAFLCRRHAKIFNGPFQVNDVRLFCDIFVFKTAS